MPVDIEIRGIGPEEFDAYYTAVTRGFNEYPAPEEVELERRLAEFERTFVAVDAGEIVAGASTASMRMTVPGSELPAAGITSVGVSPTHRRRGVASALMRRQLDHVHERGEEPIAALHASEGGIYGRYGFGVATYDCRFEIERERTAFLSVPHERGRVHLLEREEAFAAMAPVHDEVRRNTPGMIERRGPWLEYRFQDLESERDGASAFFYALHESPSVGIDAYAVYRFRHEWPEGMPVGEVIVEEVLAADADSFANMWRFVFDLDLSARIRGWGRPVDDPLIQLLVEPRRLRLRVRDGMWIRLVDVARALAARRYGREDALVFEVRDPLCPWNEGRVRLEGAPDGAACTATAAESDLVLSASELGAVYLGGVRFGQLARAGRVREETSGALRRADAMFAWDPAPWCPDDF